MRALISSSIKSGLKAVQGLQAPITFRKVSVSYNAALGTTTDTHTDTVVNALVLSTFSNMLGSLLALGEPSPIDIRLYKKFVVEASSLSAAPSFYDRILYGSTSYTVVSAEADITETIWSIVGKVAP